MPENAPRLVFHFFMLNTNRLVAAATLSDEELVRRLTDLSARARESTADLVAHLAELARRKAHREEGEGSLFMFCTRVLCLSEAAACNRIAAAYAAQRFPVLLDLLADGSVNLTTIRILAGVLTAENHHAILKEATGKTKAEVLEIKVRLEPRPDAPVSVRKVPTPRDGANLFGAVEPLPQLSAHSGAPAPPPAPSRRAVVEPLSPGRYLVQLTVDEETRERLRRLQDLLRREIPSGDPGVIFTRALILLEEQAEKKAFAATPRPRSLRGPTARSRTIPAEVRRAVWARDGGRCAFVGRSGMRCSQRSFLEFHHRDPHAHEGAAARENIALRCRAHNAHESELLFGRFGEKADREWVRIEPGL